MTPREMTTRFLHSLGRKMEGERGEIAPIMPILILDLQYQIYSHNFSKKILKEKGYAHTIIQWSTNWLNAYEKVNKNFFKVFNTDEQDEVTTIMDRLAEATNTTIVQIRCVYRKILKDAPDKELNTDLLTANLLIKLARSYWSEVYYGRHGKVGNNDIDTLLNAQTTFMNKISPNDMVIYEDDYPDMRVLIDLLCKQVVDFCFEQDNDTIH